MRNLDAPPPSPLDPRRYVPLGLGGGLVALLLVVLVLGSYYSVDQGERGIVTRMGAAVRVADPGAHLKFPLIETVTKIPTRVRALEWGHYRYENKTQDSRMESYSRDQQPAHLSIKVTYHAKADPQSVLALFSAYRSVEGYESTVVTPRTYEAVKSVFGRYSAAEAIQNRTKLNAEIEQTVRALVPADGPILVDGVQVQDIKFTPDYENAINERMKAEVEVTKVAQNLERERKQAEIKVVQAKAEAESNFARAEAQARATKLQGEAEAAAIRARGDALRENPRLVDLTLAEKWNGQPPQTVLPGSAAPFITVK